MRDRLQCEFFVIRYVPDVVKGEFANIGVILREVGREAEAAVRFTRDWSRVRCLDAHADIGLMEALEGEMTSRIHPAVSGSKSLLDIFEETLSNSIQLTPGAACLAESLPAEMEQLMRMYVEPIRLKQQQRRRTGRAAIAGVMRREFERAGVWGLMRKSIAASMYTRPGDSMKIDCGYRPNGVIRMFQAVSLDGDGEAAKVLAYSAAGLREGVSRVESAKLELTAVVEPLRTLDPDAESIEEEIIERYRFGVESMEREEIRVVTLNDVARVAETAKRELRI